uniref:Uncharacterized protein n=1 Tax=Plectus sambesii TaxID=2011161 RepID=A0A914WJI3_9BILA
MYDDTSNNRRRGRRAVCTCAKARRRSVANGYCSVHRVRKQLRCGPSAPAVCVVVSLMASGARSPLSLCQPGTKAIRIAGVYVAAYGPFDLGLAR